MANHQLLPDLRGTGVEKVGRNYRGRDDDVGGRWPVEFDDRQNNDLKPQLAGTKTAWS
jgi:hypothetical protein